MAKKQTTKKKKRVISTKKPKQIAAKPKTSRKKSSKRTPKRTPKKISESKTRTTKRTTKRKSDKYKEGITKVKVVGIGGAGGNIIARMKEKSRIRGVEYVAINTDAQDLNHTSAHRKIYIGKALTKGLGAGMNPDIGRQAAEENRSEIGEMLEGADIVFIAAGFGGGTASGAAPIIAEISKQKGILTIGIVTKPFAFEGARRMNIAQEGIDRLRENIDALVVIPNDRIFTIISKDTPIIRAFSYIDDVLGHGVQAIGELMNVPGIINIDFADIKTILSDAGSSLIGVGVASGQDRAGKAVNEAINSPLLETSIEGARGVLFSVAGGRDLKMTEINDIAKTIAADLDSNAKVIFGAYYDHGLKDKNIKVTVIATGFNNLFSNQRSLNVPHLFSKGRTVEEQCAVEKDDAVKFEPDEEQKPDSGKRTTEPKTEPWDIPAFLRKRKK